MQRTVDSFQAERLKQAIGYRALSNKALAEMAGISPATVTKYLKGNPPKEANFESLCAALDFPPAFFLQQAAEKVSGGKYWRSLASARKSARARGEIALDLQMEVWSKLAEEFNFPRFNLTDLQFRFPNFEKLSFEQIDEKALEIREFWGLEQRPIPNLIRAMEKSGILVNTFDLGVEKLDAVSVYSDKIPHVLINSHGQSASRMRFDAAHELGHILLHAFAGPIERKGEKFDLMEEQAHYFASSLLLPEEAFLQDLWAPTLACFKGLKQKWRTSIQAMMRRALNLKAITLSQYQYLNIHISKKKWRIREPLDDVIPVEKPRLFSQSMERLIEQRGLSKDDFLNYLQLPADIVESFSALQTGFFDGKNEADDSIVELVDLRKRNPPNQSGLGS